MQEAPFHWYIWVVVVFIVGMCRCVYSTLRHFDNSNNSHHRDERRTATIAALDAAAISRQQNEFRALQAEQRRRRQQRGDHILQLHAEWRQRQLERSDQNVGPIHPHSNFIVEERQQPNNNNENTTRNLTHADLKKMVPLGVSNFLFL
jgi:hypothetical protein